MSLRMYSSGEEIKDVVIKGCPFCGNQNLTITEKQSFDELCEEHGSALMQIECSVCNTVNTLYSIPDNNYWLGVGLLIAKWNVRWNDESSYRN